VSSLCYTWKHVTQSPLADTLVLGVYATNIAPHNISQCYCCRFGTDAVKLSRLPGWEGHSWGYHGDDGNSFASEREGSPYGPKFTSKYRIISCYSVPLRAISIAGDVVGCGIDYSSGRAFFTKNGRYLGNPVMPGSYMIADRMFQDLFLRV
jgi:SPRY domain